MISYAQQQMFLKMAAKFLNIPYRYGGDDPVRGCDCSGFVSELLRITGLLKNHQRFSAQMLYDHFKIICQPILQQEIQQTDLMFWAKDDDPLRIYHIAVCFSEHFLIEAGGGISSTDTLDEAAQRNAFVRIRPLRPCFKILRIF